MLDNATQKRVRACQAPTTWAGNPAHSEKHSVMTILVLLLAASSSERGCFTPFDPFWRGGVQWVAAKKQDLNKALVQNSLRLLIPEHLKRTRRMQDQPRPTNFSLRWGLIFLGGSRCSELVSFQKSWKHIGIIGPWQASTCLLPGCFAPGERAFGSSALQAWQKPKQPKQLHLEMLLRPVLYPHLRDASLASNVSVLVSRHSMERGGFWSRWSHSPLSCFYGTGSCIQSRLRWHAWRSWPCSFCIRNLAKPISWVAAPWMEKGWQQWQVVSWRPFQVCAPYQLHRWAHILRGIFLRYRSSLDALGASGHDTWHVFLKHQRNWILPEPEIPRGLVRIHWRCALAHDPWRLLGETWDFGRRFGSLGQKQATRRWEDSVPSLGVRGLSAWSWFVVGAQDIDRSNWTG